MITPRNYQKQAIDSLWSYFYSHKEGNPIIALPTGCHCKGYQILMFDGSTKAVENIKIGDLLMGPDEKPRKVLRLARGRETMVKIIPHCGDEFIVNLSHKFLMHKTREGNKYKCQEPKDEIVKLKDYIEGSKWFRHLRKLKRIPIEFSKKDYVLPPYFVGLMIGDGCLCNGTISYISADYELHEYIETISKEYGCNIKILKKENNNAWSSHIFYPDSNRSIPNPVTECFRYLDLTEKRAWEKFIPNEYKLGSIEQRLELIAGLLDSDGYMDRNRTVISLTTTSKKLANDFAFICRSVGFGINISKAESFCNGKRCRDHYDIYLIGDLTIIPFKRNRHIALVNKRKIKKNQFITGFNYEILPEDDYYGFELDKDHLYLDYQFICNHNTGKSVVIAEFIKQVCARFDGQRIMCITHRKELIDQNYKEFMGLWHEAPAGIYSAGLKRREYYYPITFCGIQSVYRKPELFGVVHLLIVDEAHLLSPKSETMYQAFISGLKEKNPYLRVIGLSATCWRMGHGLLTQDHIFNDFCYDATTPEAFNWFIENNYLSTLIPIKTQTEIDVSKIQTVGNDFNLKQLERETNKDSITRGAIEEAIKYGWDRKHWLVFATGLQHVETVSNMLNLYGIPSTFIHSKLAREERDTRIMRYKNGDFKAIVNDGILTTGFNFRPIDLIMILRASKSSSLHVQMCGRGMRPSPETGKQNCLVLDFGGNTMRLGPVNDPVIPYREAGKKKNKNTTPPVKVCPECFTINHTNAKKCISCNFPFPEIIKYGNKASDLELIRNTKKEKRPHTVQHVTYTLHHKQDRPTSLRVSYFCGLRSVFSEYVIFETPGKCISRTFKWWYDRGKVPIPETADEALSRTKELKIPHTIVVEIGGQWPRIVEALF